MSEKFKYAPGKPGFGSKGNDGSTGAQGLAMYFTNYNPTSEKTSIENAIINNYVLWSTSPTTLLPDGRVYVTGDLFVDSEGKVYEINAETNTFIYKIANLNTGGYFVSAAVSSDDGFQRYYNNNSSPKYIIDNVYATGTAAYYTIPISIYDIEPINYARIEYSNIVKNGYNPFTLYSSTSGAGDSHKAIAIVRDISNNIFRIGNLDDTGSLRNVSLIFDVSSLKQNKQLGNVLHINSEEGTILTNHEINANALFSGVFDVSPNTFVAGYSTTDISISWVLSDFTPDTGVNADLYFFKDGSKSGTFSLTNDASTYRPMVFHDCASSGTIHFQGLPTTTGYKYYMNFHKNGWERRSAMKGVATGNVPNITIFPSSYSSEPSSYHTVGFCVSSNVPWYASLFSNPGDFMMDVSPAYPFAGTYGISNASLYVDISLNTDYARTGTFRVNAFTGGGNSPVTGSITQVGIPPMVEFGITDIQVMSESRTSITKRGAVYEYNLPAGTNLDVSIYVTLRWHGNTYAPLGWTFDLQDQALNSLISGNSGVYGAIAKNATGGVALPTYTYSSFTKASSLVLWPILTVDYDDMSSDWYVYADVTVVPRYVSGPILGGLDYTYNEMCAEVPVDGSHGCIVPV